MGSYGHQRILDEFAKYGTVEVKTEGIPEKYQWNLWRQAHARTIATWKVSGKKFIIEISGHPKLGEGITYNVLTEYGYEGEIYTPNIFRGLPEWAK